MCTSIPAWFLFLQIINRILIFTHTDYHWFSWWLILFFSRFLLTLFDMRSCSLLFDSTINTISYTYIVVLRLRPLIIKLGKSIIFFRMASLEGFNNLGRTCILASCHFLVLYSYSICFISTCRRLAPSKISGILISLPNKSNITSSSNRSPCYTFLIASV